MFKIGITGGIGCGKSTVCRRMQALGVPVFYADEEAKNILNTDPAVRQQVIELLGSSAYSPSGVNKTVVAEAIFNDGAKLKGMNSIMRPAIRRHFSQWALAQNSSYVLMEAAVLIENEGHRLMDHVVIVTAPKNLRLQRAMARDGSTKEQIEARMATQMEERELLEYADSIIVNNGDEEELEEQVNALRLYLDEVAGSE